MRAMGIDPGTAICGFGVIDADGSRLKPVTYGTIQTTPDHTDAERLVMLFDGLNELYRKYKPDVIGVEQLFFNRNVTTAITVGQARGIILLTAQQAGIPILEFSPLQVKQGVTGYGRATKEQVIDMTMRLLGIRQKIKPDDAADGLAMAIYAIYSSHSMSLKREVQLSERRDQPHLRQFLFHRRPRRRLPDLCTGFDAGHSLCRPGSHALYLYERPRRRHRLVWLCHAG